MKPNGSTLLNGKKKEDFRALSGAVLSLAAKGRTTFALLKDINLLFVDFCACRSVEIWYAEKQRLFHAETRQDPAAPFSCDTARLPGLTDEWLEQMLPSGGLAKEIAALAARLASGEAWPTAGTALVLHPKPGQGADAPGWKTELLLPLPVSSKLQGLVRLTYAVVGNFAPASLEQMEEVARTVGLGLSHNQAQFDLRERVKELTCMYKIANEAAQSHQKTEDLMARIVELLPPAYLYPEITEASILLDDAVYRTPGFAAGGVCQSSDIVVNGTWRGAVEILYRESRPELDEGPFLVEERHLLDSVAREIALILERREAEKEQEVLKYQLRHADRLATIGRLAAGVAHELNEPLTGILGFAELLKDLPGMPEAARRDLGRIEAASLHAREIVRELLLFSRQLPTRRGTFSLNAVIRQVTAFLENRLAKNAIEVVYHLSDACQSITADEVQIRQVVVNLVINAIQAMPQGGLLTLSTERLDTEMRMSIRDTGVGIAPERMEKIFLPFYTDKDVAEGTGLGLSVVDGIIKAHHGRIEVESAPGRGAAFHIYLPIEAEKP